MIIHVCRDCGSLLTRPDEIGQRPEWCRECRHQKHVGGAPDASTPRPYDPRFKPLGSLETYKQAVANVTMSEEGAFLNGYEAGYRDAQEKANAPTAPARDAGEVVPKARASVLPMSGVRRGH